MGRKPLPGRPAIVGLLVLGSLMLSSCASSPVSVVVPPVASAKTPTATISVAPATATAEPSTISAVAVATVAPTAASGSFDSSAEPTTATDVVEASQVAPANAERRETVLHTVGGGETLSTIAENYGVSPETIAAANGLTNTDKLAVGQELRILPVSGVLHKVQAGDTLDAIAALYGTDVMGIVVMNGLDNPDSLKVGQELVVPGGTPPTRALLASRGGQRSGPLKPGTYVVQEGESLGSIADRFDISVETLLWANQVDDPNSIHVGDELVVLPVSGALYTVKKGDNINTIAEVSGVSAAEILMANGIDDPRTLQIGAKLLLPGGKPIRDPEPPKPTPTPKPAPKPEPPAAPAAAPAQAKPEAAQAKPAATPAPAAPPAAPLGQTTIAVAQEYIGHAYVWGGIGPNSFDCTGFVWYIFNKRLGISMPRDLWGQLGSGQRVDRANVQAGDLVFFQNTYTAGLSHVGIALDNTRFIHAASESYGVMVSRLNDAYWSARWYGATRP